MRNFKRHPGKGTGYGDHAVPESHTISDTADPERAGHLMSVGSGGVHLEPLQPVYPGNEKEGGKITLARRPSVNSSRVRAAGLP